MTRAGTRIAAIAATALLGAGTLGCGLINQVKQAAENVSAITDLADRLGKSGQLTFTAEYKTQEGSTTTVVQQPPNAAYLGKNARFILTSESLLMCQGTGAKVTCQRSPNQTQQASTADQTAYLAAVAGGGFINTEMAIALMGASALVPGVKIEPSDRKVAGQQSKCLDVTGIPADQQPNSVSAKEYTVCVADSGLLTQFTGVGTDDKKIGVELVKYSDTVDAKAFAAPTGAKIVDVTALQPPK